MIIPQITNIKFVCDSSSAKSFLDASGVDNTNILLSLNAESYDVYLYDENGIKTRNLTELLSHPIGKVGQIVVNLNNEYLQTPHGSIKIDSIVFDRQEDLVEDKLTIGDREKIAKILIQDVIENTSKYLFNDGSTGSEYRKH